MVQQLSFPFIQAPSLHWYWQAPGWDDRALEAEARKALNAGTVPSAVWKWKLPKSYNGFSGEERVAGWRIVKAALALGLIPPPHRCSVCLRTPAGQMHSEDYSRPLLAKPICPRCHRALHMRFSKPVAWERLVDRHAYDGCWFAEL